LFLNALILSNKKYIGLGLMSGSSLDGLDLALVAFDVANKEIKSWELLFAKELVFPSELKDRLSKAITLSSQKLAQLDHDLGVWMGASSANFIKDSNIEVDYIASHGHTVFHFADHGFTKQIGAAATMVSKTGIPVISDFRSSDMAHGGQGAPLAPVVEHYLYPGYEFYLNLGGIANISLHLENKIIAFDVCPANQILNKLAGEKNIAFDKGGCLAAKGKVDHDLMNLLNKDPFLKMDYPKSLDNNSLQEIYFPILENSKISTEDKLCTAVQFIANCLADAISKSFTKENANFEEIKLYITGGGAFNKFLIEKIHLALPNIELVLPSEDDINFKEAILMSLLGLLRILNKPNSFASVTGAMKDTVNGAIYKS